MEEKIKQGLQGLMILNGESKEKTKGQRRTKEEKKREEKGEEKQEE